SPAHRLHRSQSHRLPAAPGLLPLLHRNITVARPGRRTRSQSAAVLTSTPRVRRWVPKAPGRAGASASASGAAAAAVAREDSLSEPSSGVSAGTTASQDSLDRVERVSGWLEGGGGGLDVRGVVAELEGLSLGLGGASDSSCEMDVSF
ncbi:uncharacterized protein PHACADRAFT_202238, partial [Phanerochaete carnosa HHB-10118-sp]